MLLLQSLLCCCCWSEGHRTSWHSTAQLCRRLRCTIRAPCLRSWSLHCSPAPLPCPGGTAGRCPAFAGAVHEGTAISDCSWTVLMSVDSVCLSHGCTTLVAHGHLVINLLRLSPSPPLFLQAEEPAAEAQNSCEEPGRPLSLTQRREGRRN